MNEVIMEMRGMRRQAIWDYFADIHELTCHLSTFQGEHWMVEIGDEVIDNIGKLRITSTTVKFTGEKEFLDTAINNFRLRFLTMVDKRRFS